MQYIYKTLLLTGNPNATSSVADLYQVWIMLIYIDNVFSHVHQIQIDCFFCICFSGGVCFCVANNVVFNYSLTLSCYCSVSDTLVLQPPPSAIKVPGCPLRECIIICQYFQLCARAFTVTIAGHATFCLESMAYA